MIRHSSSIAEEIRRVCLGEECESAKVFYDFNVCDSSAENWVYAPSGIDEVSREQSQTWLSSKVENMLGALRNHYLRH